MLRWSIATVCMGGAWRRNWPRRPRRAFAPSNFRERSDLLQRQAARCAAHGRRSRLSRSSRCSRCAISRRCRTRSARAISSAPQRKFELMHELGPPLLCLCSNVSRGGDRRSRARGRTISPNSPTSRDSMACDRLRGARLGPPCPRLDGGLGHRARRRSAQSRHRARQFSCLRARQSDRADRADSRATRSRSCRSPTRRRC